MLAELTEINLIAQRIYSRRAVWHIGIYSCPTVNIYCSLKTVNFRYLDHELPHDLTKSPLCTQWRTRTSKMLNHDIHTIFEPIWASNRIFLPQEFHDDISNGLRVVTRANGHPQTDITLKKLTLLCYNCTKLENINWPCKLYIIFHLVKG